MPDDKNKRGSFLEALLSSVGDVALGISVEHEIEGMVGDILKKDFPFESIKWCSERQKNSSSRIRGDFALITSVSCIVAGAVFLNVVVSAADDGDGWGMMSEYTFNWKESNVFLSMGIGMRHRPVLPWIYEDERGVPRRGFAGDSFAVRQRMIV
jgi:hypothetical protein